MSGGSSTLLEATDVGRRLLQHGAVSAGIVVLAAEGLRARRHDPGPVDAAFLLLGFAFLTVGLVVKQRWSLPYRGHRIRFENSPLWSEKLFIDEELVAKGGLGKKKELSGTIRTGQGQGDEIVALSEAGLLRFRCRIFARPGAGSPPGIEEETSRKGEVS